MTVSELIDKLKDCAPGAVVYSCDGVTEWEIEAVTSDGAAVRFS